MGYSLGLDIGSINAKLALLGEDGKATRTDVERITSGPRRAVNALLSGLSDGFDLELVTGVGVSGSGKGAIPEDFHWAEYSSSLAVASGLLHRSPDARTIIQIGGQSSLVIELRNGLKEPWRVASNPLCAAGTGRFIEQQAYRLGISIDDFARLALRCEGSPPRIAARCSVFAKSDLIHLQQKGTPVEAMLYALCESIARMVGSLKKGAFEEPVHLVGGVAANGAVVRAINEMLSARNGHPVQAIVPDNFLYVPALGVGLLSAGNGSRVAMLPETDRQTRFTLPALESADSQAARAVPRIDQACTGYLGVDVGSTSTKAVIMDESGKQVMAKSYLMTAGKPIEAVKEVFAALLREGAEQVRIAGVGVTGSGRYLIGSVIGADLVKNEITAQTRAAIEIDPDADIIEIGGQDSKLVLKRNGVVVDYQMNKACAAGTGSFIDELAEMLGVPVKDGSFARLAFDAPHTIDLGTRCAAFMGQAVASAQQEETPLPVITASLANSIAKNYLSKVVGNRKLGKKVILTGAVFYNQAVVAAFRKQLEGRTLAVPEHKEVSGAIGAALLAREQMAGRASGFKGFQAVIDGQCALSTFTCKACDNNCTITRMQVPNEKPTFYGSRCDRYDSTLSHAKVTTPFDDREKLLFRDYKEDSGTGPRVGIPRALLVYDWAPLLIGFLNALGVRVMLSSQTTRDIMEKATELAHSDSCFPIKLLHGHAASLAEADYILFPCAIRLGEKEADDNQHYACPLVQASPFIVRQALDLGERLLIPVIDFSRGDADVVNNFADIALKMGFSKQEGKKAALAGIETQRKFQTDLAAMGKDLLERLRQGNQLGVVLFARAYMSQDSGANLGIAEKLAQLGVVPIPLDFLPLASVDPKTYSDRPYWSYEGKHIAGAAVTAPAPHLYGLVLTNFGCGPNSFILKMVEDIMGGKPLGQLEIDEHAAEAGIVTRLEAFVDTIRAFSAKPMPREVAPADVYRGSTGLVKPLKTLLMPRMSPHAEVAVAALEACHVRAVVLPEADQRNLHYSSPVTMGTECLPYRVTLGDFMRYYYENGHGHEEVEGIMASSYGPCRFGKYAIEQERALKNIGFDLTIRTTVSNSAYRDLNLGYEFERMAWKGIVAVDCLQRLLWRTRPYEKQKGEAERLFTEYVSRVAGCIRRREPYSDVLQQAARDFRALVEPDMPRRPLVGINGEIFLRSNSFSNNDLVKVCEAAGLEVVVSSAGEWFKYTSYRNLEDARRDRNLKKMARSYIKKFVQERDERFIEGHFKELLDGGEPSTEKLLALSSHSLSSKCGSEAVLSIGSGIEWLKSGQFSGVISVMPHGCMPGGIVAAMADRFSRTYQKPWISLTYDGFPESNNLARINDFAEVVRFCSTG